MPCIKPVSDLRNYNEVLQNVTEDSPVFLTKNGRGTYAILTIKEYEKLSATVKLFSELSKGEEGIGGYFDLNEAKITILLTNDVFIEVMLADEQKLELLASNLWCNYTHEHTHMQQAKVSKIGFKNYVLLVCFGYFFFV